MVIGRLGHLVKDGEKRIQRGHGVLENHGYVPATNLPHLPRRFLHQVFAVEPDGAPNYLAGAGQQPEKSVAGGGLAATRFSHQAHGLAGVQGEADAIHRFYHALALEPMEVCLEVGYL